MERKWWYEVECSESGRRGASIPHSQAFDYTAAAARPDPGLSAASLSARAACAVVDNHVGPSRPTPSNDVRRQSKMYQRGLAPPGNAPDQKGLRREFQVSECRSQKRVMRENRCRESWAENKQAWCDGEKAASDVYAHV